MALPAEQSTPIPWRRRLLRFSLRRLMLLVLLCAIGLGWPQLWRVVQFQRLKAFAGQDLRQLSETEAAKFAGIIRAVSDTATVSETTRYPIQLAPWFVWPAVADDGEPLTVLFEGSRSYLSPSGVSARICVLGRFGAALSEASFRVGWRNDIVDVQWQTADEHPFDRIKVSLLQEEGGLDIRAEYYAIVGRDVALVRLEDTENRPVRVDYRDLKQAVGPGLPARSAEQWAEALGSRNPAEVLRTLVWLGAIRPQLPLSDPARVSVESAEDAQLAARVRARADVQQALGRLAADPDSWVSEAAQAARDESAVTTDPSN